MAGGIAQPFGRVGRRGRARAPQDAPPATERGRGANGPRPPRTPRHRVAARPGASPTWPRRRWRASGLPSSSMGLSLRNIAAPAGGQTAPRTSRRAHSGPDWARVTADGVTGWSCRSPTRSYGVGMPVSLPGRPRSLRRWRRRLLAVVVVALAAACGNNTATGTPGAPVRRRPGRLRSAVPGWTPPGRWMIARRHCSVR